MSLCIFTLFRQFIVYYSYVFIILLSLEGHKFIAYWCNVLPSLNRVFILSYLVFSAFVSIYVFSRLYNTNACSRGGSRGKSDSCKLIIVMELLGGSGACSPPRTIFKSRTSETPYAAICVTFSIQFGSMLFLKFYIKICSFSEHF